ncbi:hypothetical protein B0T24DRAFT_635247 [Lasiosphaeria ovina]|uniref:Glycosyl transferase family 8 protein n=1 Tax=Lasiosphaeria ovina TaxID=92902 RepID=A0AAE0K0B2_9PEZI|nr:hypothetical protein B0T24DRAFT_635247 [Lasiosphaeria ovina]
MEMALPPLNTRFGRRGRRYVFLVACFALGFIFTLKYSYTAASINGYLPKSISKPDLTPKPVDRRPPTSHAPPKYKPTPTWAPPAITDPFPLLATSTAAPPPIPEYNVPRVDMHKEYGFDKPPPLFIGFTRNWPMLLQAVVSYITAGWPPEGIYVVENTGVHSKNREGKLSLQNPFYLNYTTLARLGVVNVVPTPTLLTFSQLQNAFLSLAYSYGTPYYFYSHQDVVVFSFENGTDREQRPGDREWHFYDAADEEATMGAPAARERGYRTIYENCLRELADVERRGERWGFRWHQYDHLTLVNRHAVEAVGGWDALIPYYMSDCDMNGKLAMDGWSMRHRRVGIVNDVSSVLDDLEALYRSPHVDPAFTDPNPLPPDREAKIIADKAAAKAKADDEARAKLNSTTPLPRPDAKEVTKRNPPPPDPDSTPVPMPTDPLAYFSVLSRVGTAMGWHKYRDRDKLRNTWQRSQRGGAGEPFYYDPAGFARAFELLTDAGRAVYAEKWGHRDCDIAEKTALRLEDQWRVEKDWEKKKEGG